MIIQIDALYFMLLVEVSVVLLVLTFYLFSQRRKYKKLYQKSLKDPGNSSDLPVGPPEQQERSSAVLEDVPEPVSEATPQEQETTEPALKAPEIMDPSQIDAAFSMPDEGVDDGTPEGRIKRLQRMVMFQKNTILELMCYKDIFEGAHRKLAALQQTNDELQDKIRGLTESGVVENVGIAEPLSAFESNSHDLEKFIGILDRENAMLSEKFRTWEEEFRRIAEDVGEEDKVPCAVESNISGVDEGKYLELTKEKEALLAQVKDFEEKLLEKGSDLEALKLQYEDLEKEYMILYRQQQQQEQQQQQQQQP